jgi:hypothetical protein
VDTNGITSIIRGLAEPRGMTGLLRHLGFTRPLRRVPRPPGAPAAVRQVQCSARGTLVAWVATFTSELDPSLLRELMRSLRDSDAVRHHLVVVVEHDTRRVAVACDSLNSAPRHVLLDPYNVRACDIDALVDLQSHPGESDTAAALRIARGLDRSRVTDRFFRDVVAVRNLVARSWTGIPGSAAERRDGLALLLLSRLMFLYFLQRQGLLNGEQRFLPRLLSEWTSQRQSTTFYRGMLGILFFGVLNRKPSQRCAQAAALGTLPYLNGGLFEVHRLELETAELDLSDEVLRRVFADVLDKYRFTTSDAADHQLNGDVLTVDPEMLGRIFEGLMPGDRRGRTGTFYTPASLVDRVVVMALTEHLASRCGVPASVVDVLLHGEDPEIDAGQAANIRNCADAVRVLDPACGSGAFLLGALSRLATIRAVRPQDAEAALGVRREIVASALHGVDLLEDAALICSLRLWLALVPQCSDSSTVPPLPNLDRRIRQGDALVDPLDLGSEAIGRPLDTSAPPELRRLLQSLESAGRRYLGAGPDTRPALRRELHQLESAVARCWLGAFESRLSRQARELTARAGDRDLFGAHAAHAVAAERQLKAVERRRTELQEYGTGMNVGERLPFFSFRVHFAGANPGFDIILSNPPWVRSHKWPPPLRRLLRERYQVCATAGWPYAAAVAGMPHAAGAQVDLSLLFLEKSVRLLAQNGTLGMLLPSKLLRSLYAAGAREMLLQQMQLLVLEDHSLDHRALFDADAFTAVLLARKGAAQTSPGDAEPAVRVTLGHSAGPSLHFEVQASELPLRLGDARSPWLLVPPECRAVMRQMQQSGPPLGEAVTIRRGAMTGANEVLVIRDVEPRLGDLARIRTEGYHRAATPNGRRAYTGWIEASCLRPALRGADVEAWSASVERHLIWTPYNSNRLETAPPRLKKFLHRHRSRLGADVHSRGALHRLSDHALGDKVVWSDLAADLRAAAVPAKVRNIAGIRTPVIPLNTVYFVATSSPDESMLLSAYLNSLPLRVFARAIAERAKDRHFRFFAWTIAVLPIPADWRTNRHAASLREMAQKAHADGGMTVTERMRLDDLVATAYRLNSEQLLHLRLFDGWLRGRTASDGVAV